MPPKWPSQAPAREQMADKLPADQNPLRPLVGTGRVVLAWLQPIVAAVALLALAVYLPAVMYPALSAHRLAQLHISPQARVAIQDDQYTLQNNARTAFIQILAGIAVLSGATVAWRQFRHSITDSEAQRNAQRATFHLEHYSKAIEYIGNVSATVRLGGVHLLAMLAETSTKHRAAVSDVLASFISNRSPWPPTEDGPSIGTPPGRLTPLSLREPDIQGAITAIATYGGLRQGVAPPLRLMRCDLRAANMIGACLENVNFTASHLEATELQHSHLARTTFTGACLSGANLTGADLSHADLRNAELNGSITEGIKLDGAVFNSSTVWPRGFAAADAERLGARRDG